MVLLIYSGFYKVKFLNFVDFKFLALLAPVPGKPISANRGLNIANRRINFIPRLDSVPESTINLNLGIN